MSGVGLAITLSIPDADEFASAARMWFRDVPALLAPAQWEQILREDRPPFRGRPQAEWPLYDDWREPFMLWAEITVAPLKWRGMRVWQRRATASNLRWLEEALADRPVSAGLSIFQVDANGIMLPGGVGITAEAALSVGDQQVPVARLLAGESRGWLPEGPAGRDELCGRQARLASAWASRADVTSLFGGEEVHAVGESALSYSLTPKLNWWEAVQRWDLPGYSWLTLCPVGVPERLGGAGALEASGAFWRVDELPGGAVLLRATERAADYGLGQARKIYDVLAPALPEGLPCKPPEWPQDLPWLVVPEDAAQTCGRAGSSG